MSAYARPRRNFNPEKSGRYGLPTFTPDILVKYSPKWQYSRLFNFPFRGSHFRPRMRTLVLSIDGGCRVNDRSKDTNRAACAVYFGLNCPFNYAATLHMLSPKEAETSNRAELSAAICALDIMERRIDAGEVDLVKELIIKTDSEYVARSMHEWVWAWEKNGWTKSGGRSVKNHDLMRRLHEKIKVFEQEYRMHVRFWRVGREWNEEADAMVDAVLDG